MTAAERMKHLAGLSGVSAGAMLRKIGVVGLTAATLLTSYSGIDGATAAVNLLHEKQTQSTPVSSVAHPAGLGGSYDSGTGFVKKDHGWVQMTKYAVTGGITFNAEPSVRAGPNVDVAHSKGHAHGVLVAVQLAKSIDKPNAIAYCYQSTALVSAGVEVGRGVASLVANPCSVDWLGLDEIMAIVEMGR